MPIRTSRLGAALLLGSLVGAMAACGAPRTRLSGSDPIGGKLITAEQIRRDGSRNAWDALKRGGTHLSMRESSTGEPTRIWYRGHASIVSNASPLLIVDGVPIPDLRFLRQIPAAVIASIRVLPGVAGARYYGTMAGQGLIMVQTRSGSESSQ